jgi:murein DD-endopeptidase MepM/ murein hydrolase activator NlpD
MALLAALVAGGIGAGLLGVQSLPSAIAEEPASVSAVLASDVSGLDAEGFDEESEVAPQVAITEVEAKARLTEVAASRAQRAAKAAAKAEAAAAAAEAARPDTVSPVHGARLSSTFAARWGRMHWGIDLAAPLGTPEYTVEDGIVLRAGPASGYGNVVYVLHESGDVTVYGHMRRILVRPGEVVRAGDQIAELGNEGHSTGPHLHFEVWKGGLDGHRVDPLGWLHDRGVQV